MKRQVNVKAEVDRISAIFDPLERRKEIMSLPPGARQAVAERVTQQMRRRQWDRHDPE